MTISWKPYPSQPEYLVSDTGWVQGPKGRVLKPVLIGPPHRTYRFVNVARLRPGKKHTLVKIPWMVLETFVGPRPDGQVCCHWDDDSHNDDLSNLRWATWSENQLDIVRNGNHWEAKQETCRNGHNEWKARSNGKRLCIPCNRQTRRRRQNYYDGEDVL